LTHSEIAASLFRERRIWEAARQYQLGTAAGQDPEPGALERWLTYMMAGEFELAWQESDRVLRNRRHSGQTCAHLPEHQRWLWDGTPLNGRHVLVRCFHGLGDTIQFVRFLPQLRALCSKVSFLPQAELSELIPPVREEGDPDIEIELMEVPHALRLTLKSLPAEYRYLKVSGAEPRSDSLFRVGLVWASGAWRPERSIPLPDFRFLNGLPGLELIGLQRGPAALQRPPNSPLFHQGDWRNTSIVETARTIRSLDLVITTDTMVAHLAGALGVPVWTLLHWDADWRWMVDRDDSPWYPSMRLFRQAQPGDWSDVLNRVRTELTHQHKQVREQQADTSHNAEGA